MTRRERMANIVMYQAENLRRWEIQGLAIAFERGDFSSLSDEGLEKLAAACVRHQRRNRKMIEENRRRRHEGVKA